MADTRNKLPVPAFYFRLSSRVPEDVRLSRLMAEDLASGEINLSAVIKSLLLSWYQQRQATGDLVTSYMVLPNATPAIYPITAPQPEEPEFDPDDELVKRLANPSFNF